MHAERFKMRSTAAARLVVGGRRWLGGGANLLFPPECSVCRAELPQASHDTLVCGACRAVLIDGRPACPKCGSSTQESAEQSFACRCASERPFRFQAVVRLGRYEGLLRQAVLRTKRQHEQPLAMALGRLLAASRSESLSALRCQAVVAVPMHWSRRIWRGVNSPELLAHHLARSLQIPAAGHLLRRCRRTRPQANLAAGERLANVRGAFRVRPHRDLAGARVLLVDDIMTTGATGNEAAKMLYDAGAEFVALAVLARAQGDDF